LALATLLYRSKTRVIREWDKSRITPGEIKFMRMAKYAWQDYKTSEIFRQNLKLKKIIIITEMNGYNIFDTVNDEMSAILQTSHKNDP